VQGIEKIKILFAVDTSETQDNIADSYITASSITKTQWNESRVLGAKIFVLVRANNSDATYTDKTTSYNLGDTIFSPTNLHYRRLLIQSTIDFKNMKNQDNES